MNIPNIKGLSTTFKTVKSFVTANSPVLLTGAAVAGVVTTGVLSAKAGWKAHEIVLQHELEYGEKTTTQDKIKLTWLCYAVPAVTGATTIASVVGVHTIHTKRHAAMAGLYAMTTAKLDEYQDKAEEMLGAKKSQALRNELAQREVDRNPLTESTEVIITDGGSELMFDEFSGRYLKSSMNKIEEAVNNVNALINNSTRSAADLNEFYDFIGLQPIPMGSQLGWGGGDHMGVEFGSVMTTDGRSAVSFGFRKLPTKGFDSFR